MLEAFITVLFTSPLPVALVLLGVLCVGIAIIGKIPPMDIGGIRAIALAGFGLLLIVVAVVLAWILTSSLPTDLTSGQPPTLPTVSVSNQSTANPPQITAQPTSATSGLRWEQEVAQVPENGTTLKWELSAGQLLYLSGGQIRINGEYCGGDANQICVLLFQATTAQTVIVDALVPKNNWYGISSTLTPDEALSEKEPQFWYQPNCTNGCKKATVFYFTDGQLVNKVTLTP